MKANELMLGDWVVYRGDAEYTNPVRIEGMDILTNALITEDREDVGFDGIEPIPLTAEILEKNGIKLEEVGDNGISTPPKWRNRFEKWALHTQWKDTFIWYDRTAKYWHLHDMGAAKLHYVHELQRALRCCGLYEEANNITV